MNRVDTLEIIGHLKAEERDLDKEISGICADIESQRLVEIKQEAAFIEQVLKADYDSDYKQLINYLHEVKLRLLNFCNITLDDDCKTAIRQLVDFHTDQGRRLRRLEREICTIEESTILQELKSVPDLDTRYREFNHTYSQLQGRMLELENLYKTYYQQLEKVKALRAEKQIEASAKDEIDKMIAELEEMK